MVRNTENDVAERIKQKHNGTLEYLSGYKNKDSVITVRCLLCGETFERTYHHLTTHPNACPACKERERINRAQNEKAQREKRKRVAEVNKIRRASQLRIVVCEICGETFLTWNRQLKYCSDSCRKESARRYAAYNYGSDDRLNKSNIVDRDIDLKELFKRDKGVCQICGGLCDYSDCYTNKNGTFITGNAYPSKDHIVPLSMGGKHSWDNVRLAHRGCNSKYYWKNQRFVPSLGAESCERP